jgi:hypothetical protein
MPLATNSQPQRTASLPFRESFAVRAVVSLVGFLLLVSVFSSPIRGESGLSQPVKATGNADFLLRNFSTCPQKRLVAVEHKLPEHGRNQIASQGGKEEDLLQAGPGPAAIDRWITSVPPVPNPASLRRPEALASIPLRC